MTPEEIQALIVKRNSFNKSDEDVKLEPISNQTSEDELKTKAPDSSSEAGYTIIPELYEYCLGVGLELSNYQAVELTKLILADRKKQVEQAYSDGFQKASKGAFKSQQAAKREAVEEVLDRLESKLVERRVDNAPYAPGKEYLVPEAAIEAERNKLKEEV